LAGIERPGKKAEASVARSLFTRRFASLGARVEPPPATVIRDDRDGGGVLGDDTPT
jgi:hypothetical protein